MVRAYNTIDGIEELKGRRVLVRASLNVPILEGRVANDFRLCRALPTLEWLHERGARTIVVGHIGRESDMTLEPVFQFLRDKLPIKFVPSTTGELVRDAAGKLKDGELLLLENLRSNPGETKNDASFAKELALLADIFVNDAFAASHRKHASIVGVPAHLQSFAGLNFVAEVEHLKQAERPPSGAFFALGGAKFETKGPLIEKFLDIYAAVFVGGALANDLFRARGYEVGKSLVSDVAFDFGRILNHPNLMLPADVVVESPAGALTKSPQDVRSDECILDAGSQTMKQIMERARQSSFILWNGPLGNYERGFAAQTEALAHGIASLDTPAIVGGGDTIAAIAKLDLFDKFDFVSTGGGAMLEYLEAGTLPGLEALKRSASKTALLP
jgi:phosphoglycerate kinase